MLELFPTAVLDTSILTAVLVGLVVVWLLQEWLGFGLSGLVVPGYLASVLAIQPLTGGVIIVEALGTWLIMVALSDAIPRWWPWSPLFGRDRFFLALLGSVGVRLAMEGAVFPLMAEKLDLRVASELHSMGLVVVPLLAYAIWRSGPIAALPRMGVPVLITWAVLELFLLSHTNLSLSSFELTYEDLAVDFVGSPRAYVLLLCGAWLGSLTNLRYGWDFGGIIVPGLLALCWLQPERLAATLGEAVLIWLALKVLLRLPALREINLAGARMLVLAMLVGYGTKFALGHVLGAGWPGLRLRQLFGFGYLLPALMSLRMVRSGDPFRTLVPSVATSLAGFVLGTGLAWILAVWLPAETPNIDVAPDHSSASLMLAAWSAQGPPPADLGAALDQDQPVALTGGNGFGALWVKPGGRPMVVSARVGVGPDAHAALALAELLDARAVLLCGERGRDCDEARRRLGLRMPVLTVTRGPAASLHHSGRALDVFDPAELEAVLGPLQKTRSERDTRLVLPEALAWALAARVGEAPVQGFVHPLATGLETPAQPAASGTSALVAHDLMPPLVAWSQGAAWADDALQVATAAASRAGAQLSAAPERISVQAADWRVVVRRGARPLILHVPHVEDDPNVAALGLTLAELLDASVVVLDSPPTWRNQAMGADRVAHHAVLGALEVLAPDVEVVTLRGIRDLQDPGADIVLSLGRPLLPPEGPPVLGLDLDERLRAAGLATIWFDGDPARLSFRDGGNPVRLATTVASAAGQHVTLFASSLVRARATPPMPPSLLFSALDQSSLPMVTLQARELVTHSGIAGSEWTPWWEAATELRLTGGGSYALQQLQRRAQRQDAQTVVVCDPLAGCRWLAALRCDARRCDGAVAGLSPTPLTPDAPPLERLLLGDGAATIVDMPRPPELGEAAP